MEEKKATATKVVNLRPEEKKSEKMSYEQLENIAHQLSEQVRQLYSRLQESNLTNMFRRLDYLFKVIENAHVFGEEFVTKCITEIEEIITVPETVEENKDNPTE